MVDKCSCKNECSSKKQGFQYLTQYSFPKKLLIATSLVVIIAMCLRPAEAASIEHKSRRLHEHMTKSTKDTAASKPEALIKEKNHKRRHQGSQMRNGDQSTKEPGSIRRTRGDLYDKVQKKIENKFANTKHNFDERRRNLPEPRPYGTGMTTWLPRTNFVKIHFNNPIISQKSKAARSKKRIFAFLVKKLYKSLLEYHELFKIFQRVKVVSPDTQITSYNIKRHDFLAKTTGDLNSTIGEIKEAMDEVKMAKPKFNLVHTKFNDTDMKVDAPKYLKNDDILFRAYGNFLHNWYLEFNCSKTRKTIRNTKAALQKCINYEKSLQEKQSQRNGTKKISIRSYRRNF